MALNNVKNQADVIRELDQETSQRLIDQVPASRVTIQELLFRRTRTARRSVEDYSSAASSVLSFCSGSAALAEREADADPASSVIGWPSESSGSLMG